MEWKPATIDEVNGIVKTGLANCDEHQAAVFRQYAVEPYLAPILRHSNLEHVVVVARKANEVLYWEDVEEGFEVSPPRTRWRNSWGRKQPG